MIEIEFPRVSCPTRIFYVKITCGTDENVVDINSRLLSFGNMTIGSDEVENEMILYPGNFVISFLTDTIQDYYFVMEYLKNYEAIIYIHDEGATGDLVFKAKSKYETIAGDPTERTITLTFYDDFKQLNESFVRPDDGSSDYYTIDDIIQDTLGIDFDAVEIVTDMLFQYEDGGNHYDFPISEFAFHRKNKFFDFKFMTDADPLTYLTIYHYATKGQVLLSLLNQFASCGVLGLNRVFYIVPRFYSGGAVVNLTKVNSVDGKFRVTLTKEFMGLRIFEKTTDVFYAHFDYGTVIHDDVTHEYDFPEKLELVYIPAGLNSDDESNVNVGYAMGVRRKDSAGNLFLISINYSKYKQAAGTYSSVKTLLNWIGNLIWSNIKGSRKKYFIEMPGTDFNFTQFFTVEGEANMFRPIKISYNFMNDSTELTVVECSSIQEFTPT